MKCSHAAFTLTNRPPRSSAYTASGLWATSEAKRCCTAAACLRLRRSAWRRRASDRRSPLATRAVSCVETGRGRGERLMRHVDHRQPLGALKLLDQTPARCETLVDGD